MLQLYFPFNGDLKNYGYDVSQNFAPNIANPVFVPGAQEDTLAFSTDGYNTGRWEFTSMIGATQWTISYWLYMSSTVTSITRKAHIFNFGISANGQDVQTFRDEIVNNTKGTHQLYIAKDPTVGGNINNVLNFTGSRNTAKNKWVHIVIRKANDYLDYFEDNVRINHIACDTFESVPSVITDGIQFGIASTYTGARIQDWRFYDNVLTDNEIDKLYKFPLKINNNGNNKKLDIWLPLVANYLNQGIANVDITANNVTLDTNGKIGQCYSFNGTNSYLRFPYQISSLDKKWSFSCWVKFNDITTNQVLIVGRKSMGKGMMIVYLGNQATPQLRFDNGDDTTSSQTFFDFTPVVNTWYHLTFTQSNEDSGIRKLYINGVLNNSVNNVLGLNLTNTSEYLIIGASGGTAAETPTGNFLNGSLNDIRLYNYALSESEIKRISKGLILHYPLNDKGLETTTNLLPSPYLNTYSTISPGWDSSKHPNAVAVGGTWSNGYNYGVTDADQGYHAMWNIIDGIPTIVFQNHNSEISNTNRWMGITNISSVPAASAIPANTLYTISYEQKTIDTLGGWTTAGLYYRLTSSGVYNFHDGGVQKIGQNTKLNTWERFSYTFTRNSSVSSESSVDRFYIYGNNGAESTMLVRNIQLEVKDHATSFVMYNTTSTPNSNITDISGNSYNGIVLTPPIESKMSNLKRYHSSINKIVDTTAQIDSQLKLTFLNASPFSISFWAYSDDWNTPNASAAKHLIYAYGTNNGGFCIYSSSGAYRYRIYWCDNGNTKRSVYYSAKSGLTPEWHHFVATYDGSVMRTYRNGVQYSSGTYTFKETASAPTLKLFGSGLNSPNGTPGQLSDLRIYATCLSMNEIKNLYAMGKLVTSTAL